MKLDILLQTMFFYPELLTWTKPACIAVYFYSIILMLWEKLGCILYSNYNIQVEINLDQIFAYNNHYHQNFWTFGRLVLLWLQSLLISKLLEYSFHNSNSFIWIHISFVYLKIWIKIFNHFHLGTYNYQNILDKIFDS